MHGKLLKVNSAEIKRLAAEEQQRAAKRDKQLGSGAASGAAATGSGNLLNKMKSQPAKVPKSCSFWNLGSCKFGNDCSFKHVCWKCGGDPKWVNQHA